MCECLSLCSFTVGTGIIVIMSKVKKYDVIVVGAGPAGSMAARYAAQGGCNTLLIERKDVVGIPVRCGEAVGFKGFSKSSEIKKKWILSTINKISMISPSGYNVDLVNKTKIGDNYILDRQVMDKDLAEDACKAGVELINGTTILTVEYNGTDTYTCKSECEEYRATAVILADGVESRLARDLGWNTALSMENIETCAICIVEHEKIEDGVIEFHVGNKIAPCGFLWVFPRGDNSANIGLGILGKKSKPGLAKQLLEDFVARTYPGAVITRKNCGGVPVGKWLRPLVKDGVMVVGDAARQVSSLTGGGITYSLFAGKNAGEIVAKAKQGDSINYKKLLKYQKIWAQYCGKQQERSHALKSMLLEKNNDKFYDSIAQSLLRENPEKLSYMRVFFRTFAKHPSILLKTFLLFR